MPELPEVETLRRQVEPYVTGRVIVRSWARLERITRPSVHAFVTSTQGRGVNAVRRHGKQLFLELDHGGCLLIHLGMSGRLAVAPSAPLPDQSRHVHGFWELDTGAALVFTDPRTFGELRFEADASFTARMGADPTLPGFEVERVVRAWRGRRVRVKAALLDQRVVAGVGNIYADEVCWLAGIHPEERLDALSDGELRALVEHVAPTLLRGISARGATLKDGGYQDLFGVEGAFIPDAYGRTGDPCRRCGVLIVRGTLGAGKSARAYHACPGCQRLSRPDR